MTTPQDETPGISLPPELAPPEGLERKVLKRLARRGLVRRTGRLPGILWLTGALAATLAGFALGWVTGRAGVGVPARVTPQVATDAQYLLLLSSDRPSTYSAAERRNLVQEYRQWAEQLSDAGRLVAAEELADGGMIVWRDVVKPVSVDENTPGGFFLVTARDSAEALATARESPHWRRGGTIAIRPVRHE